MQTQYIPASQSISHWGLTNTIQMSPTEKFDLQFRSELTTIKEQIEQLPLLSIVGGERQDATDVILAGISRLSSETTDAIKSGHVNSYSQERYAEALRALTDALNEATDRFAPKSRFKFKPRAANAAPSSHEQATDARYHIGGGFKDPVGLDNGSQPINMTTDGEARDSVGNLPNFPKNYNEEMQRPDPSNSSVRKPSFSSAKMIAISGQYGLHIMLPSSASRATSSGSLKELDRCIVDMLVPTSSESGTPFAQLQINDLSKCLVIAGHVDGSAHITNVKDSVIVVAARQVRLHGVKNTTVYMHVRSHPIIEDCENVKVAPLPQVYSSKDSQSTNQWDKVNDFQWLKQEPSPNWRVLPEQERITHQVWTEVVPGGPSMNTDSILRRVGVL